MDTPKCEQQADFTVNEREATAHPSTHTGIEWLVDDNRTVWAAGHQFLYIVRDAPGIIADARATGLTVKVI